MTNAAVAQEALTARPSTELVEAIAERFDEPTWLRDHRLAALAHYAQKAWPSGQEEPWRRTPLDATPLDHWVLALSDGVSPASFEGLLPEAPAGAVVQVDAGLAGLELSPALAAKGVILLPLSQAAREHETLVAEHLNSILPIDDPEPGSGRFTSLSSALWTQGLFCYVPPNVAIDETLYHLMGKTTANAGVFGHTLIVIDEGALATVVEMTASDPSDGASLAQRSVEVVARRGSQLNLVQLNAWGDDVHVFTTTHARLGDGTRLVNGSAAFGGRLHKDRVKIEVGANGSHADLFAVFVGDGRQHIEHYTRQVHDQPGSSSELIIKGALDGDSEAVQYGSIHITPNGQRTNAEQTMRNLLLSDGASADPIPVLEIEADDVKCAHAAAVGALDPEQLFYLESRGIDPESAEGMVVHGFLTTLIDRLPDAHTRDLIEEFVERKL
ncbi:MAG: Fe-S cluster assembly protein SufD [Chloroflexi bacterium]|nr:Fe-S cluster assembly protein SufD [Chloroflexota bacterium]